MKSRSLVLALAVVVLSAFGGARAGADPTNTFALGLEAGANFSNFIGSDVTTSGVTNSRLGLVGGAFLSLNFGNTFAIRPEILYAQKGGKDTSNDTYQLDYVEVPVLLKFSLGTPVINPALLLGPTFNFNTVASVVTSGGDSSAIQNVNSSDIGLMAGVELDFDKFFVTGRYELGFDDVTKASSNNNVQNGVITAMVGYSFI